MAIIVISFDGVEDKIFEGMANKPEKYPNIAKFKERAIYRGGVKSIFVSNTYPVHTTISTGRLPKEHGVISNYADYGNQSKWGKWAQSSRLIKTETIWDAAAKKGLNVAALIWPVTYGADIRWNIPEVHFPKAKKKPIIKRSNKFERISAVRLDDITASIARFLLRKKRPDLTLVHLVAYDTILHAYGSKSEEMALAKKSLDKCLGKILETAGNSTVLVFSDHSHLDVIETVDLKAVFGANVYEQCGGSAFLREEVNQSWSYPWFNRFLTRDEMDGSGYAQVAAVGIAAKPGYSFSTVKRKSDHGYPIDYENYRVFYAAGNSSETTETAEVFGDVRDITGIITKELGLELERR